MSSYLENYSVNSELNEEAKLDIGRERSFINSHLTKELLERLNRDDASELSGRASRIESIDNRVEE